MSVVCAICCAHSSHSITHHTHSPLQVLIFVGHVSTCINFSSSILVLLFNNQPPRQPLFTVSLYHISIWLLVSLQFRHPLMLPHPQSSEQPQRAPLKVDPLAVSFFQNFHSLYTHSLAHWFMLLSTSEKLPVSHFNKGRKTMPSI